MSRSRTKQDALPRGLSRSDHSASNVHARRVQKKDGAFIYFGDASFGGKTQALTAALTALLELPIIGICVSRSRRNTSGVIGVCPVKWKGRQIGFKAVAGSPSTRHSSNTFLFSKHGENGAFLLASARRREMVEEIRAHELKRRNKRIHQILSSISHDAIVAL